MIKSEYDNIDELVQDDIDDLDDYESAKEGYDLMLKAMNLTDIQTGIIVQLDGKERLFIQKFGRSLRAEDPVAFIFYFKDTQDEVYLKNALENIDAKYVQHIDINHLNTIKL